MGYDISTYQERGWSTSPVGTITNSTSPGYANKALKASIGSCIIPLFGLIAPKVWNNSTCSEGTRLVGGKEVSALQRLLGHAVSPSVESLMKFPRLSRSVPCPARTTIGLPHSEPISAMRPAVYLPVTEQGRPVANENSSSLFGQELRESVGLPPGLYKAPDPDPQHHFRLLVTRELLDLDGTTTDSNSSLRETVWLSCY